MVIEGFEFLLRGAIVCWEPVEIIDIDTAVVQTLIERIAKSHVPFFGNILVQHHGI